MIIYPLTYLQAKSLQEDFQHIIGLPLTKEHQNFIIKEVKAEKFENIWIVKVTAYNKKAHEDMWRQLMTYIEVYLPDFDYSKYGLKKPESNMTL